MEIKDPKSQFKTEAGKLSKYENDAVKELRKKIRGDDDARASWKSKMAIAENQRMGVGRYTNLPYENAPDIPLPETDKLIKKAVSTLVLSSWMPKKLATIKPIFGISLNPENTQLLANAEAEFNAMLRNANTDLFNKLCLAADTGKTMGHALFRVYKEFRTVINHYEIDLNDLDEEGIDIERIKALGHDEKVELLAKQLALDPADEDDNEVIEGIIEQFDDGNDIIEYDLNKVISTPNLAVDIPTKVFVPRSTTDIGSSERITREEWWTERAIQDGIDKEIFRDVGKLKELLEKTNDDDDSVEKQKAQNEGVSEKGESDLYRVEIVNCYHKRKESDKEQRWIFMFLADLSDSDDATLFSKPFPYDFDEWDYEKYNNEIKDKRYYNPRGVPEQVRAIQEIMERSVNNMLIRDEYNNMPLFKVLSSSEIADSTMAVAPGDKLIVGDMGEIEYVNKANAVDLSSERIMQYLKATVEEYQGVNDQLFRNATNKGGGKTLGEIEVGMQATAPIHSVDIINWNSTISKVYTKLFNIFLECKEMTIPFPVEVRSNGNLEVSDQELATRKAYTRLVVAGEIMKQGAPIMNLEDFYNAYKDWLEKDGVKDPELFSTHPAEVLKDQLGQMFQQLKQLQGQAEEIKKQNQKGTKQLARTDEKIDKEIAKFEGKMEVKGEEA